MVKVKELQNENEKLIESDQKLKEKLESKESPVSLETVQKLKTVGDKLQTVV